MFRNFLTSFVFLAIFMFTGQLFAQTPNPNLLKREIIEVTLDTTITNDPFLGCNQKTVGSGFTATIKQDIFIKGSLVVSAGAKAHGRVTDFFYKEKEGSLIDLELTEITLLDGTVFPIKTLQYKYYKNNKKPGFLAIVGNAALLSVFYGALFSVLSSKERLDGNRNFGLIGGGTIGLTAGLIVKYKGAYIATPIYLASNEPLFFWVKKK